MVIEPVHAFGSILGVAGQTLCKLRKKAKGSRRAASRSWPRRRWSFELLEDRCVPSAIGFVQDFGTSNKTANSTSLAVTVPAAGIDAGHAIIIAFEMQGVTGTVSATDSAGNTYHDDADVTNSSNDRTVIL